MFEVVYTLPDWYDGPRRGIADCNGVPYLFESEWNDPKDMGADTFLLVPLHPDVFQLALEEWAIWRRWETAFHNGMTTNETHPALPDDRTRHKELRQLLEGRLIVDPSRAMRKKAEFRFRNDSSWSGYGWRPLEVKWDEAPSQDPTSFRDTKPPFDSAK